MKKLVVILCLMLIPCMAFAKTALDYGIEYTNKGNYETAKQYLSKAIKQDANNYQAHYYLGLVYNKMGNRTSAVSELKQVLVTSPAYTMEAQYARRALESWGAIPKSVVTTPAQSTPTVATTKTTQTKKSSAKNQIGENYFASMQQTGHIYRWRSFPVKVYINHEHSIWVRRAFTDWATASKGIVSFTFISDPSQANITVTSTTSSLPTHDDGQMLGVTEYSYRASDKSLVHADIKILKKDPITKLPVPKEVVYSVIIHEAGHALGLDHSPKCTDIMATHCTKEQIAQQKISARDLNTLKLLYNKY